MDERQDLHFTISYALWRARQHLPAGKPHRDRRESYRVAVDEIIGELDRAGYEMKKRAPSRPPAAGSSEQEAETSAGRRRSGA